MAGSTWKQRAVLLLVPVVCTPLALLWLYFKPVEPWTVFLGRFHPVVLHLPIGVLGLTALMESLNLMSFGRLRLATAVPLFVGVASAVMAMTLGVLLMDGEQMEGPLVLSHLRWGIATAALAVVTLALRCWPNHDARPGLRRLYFVALFSTCGAMTFASHRGASITHGETYLTDHLPWKADANPDPEAAALASALARPVGERRVFDHLVSPMFADRCYECHRSRSFKGRLVMDTRAGLLKGGATGPAIVPGSARESLALVRIHLPLADEEHMPPADEPQLTDDEIRVLTWWIEHGASFDATVTELDATNAPAAAIEGVTADLLAQLAADAIGGPENGHDAAAHTADPTAVAAARAPLEAVVAELRDRFPGRVRYLDEQSAGLEVTSFAPPWSDDDTAALADVAPQICRLALPRSTLTVRSAAVFNQMTRLERLDLRSAAVDDAFVAALALPNLRELNLFGSAVTDAAVPALAGLGGLRSLYLGSTPMTAGAVQRLRQRLPDCNVRYAAPVPAPDPPREPRPTAPSGAAADAEPQGAAL